MKVVVFIVSFVLFLGGLVTMGYASAFEDWVALSIFSAGILLSSLAFMIPFHLLERFD